MKRKLKMVAEDGIGVLVVLDEDQKNGCVKKINEIGFAIATVKERIGNETLDVNMRECVLGMVEFHIAELGTIVGYDSLAKEKIEERSKEIRECNLRIRELEEQLGSGKAIDGLSEQLTHLAKVIDDWWRGTGIGHIYDGVRFTNYGSVEVELKISVGSRTFEERKERSKKEIIARLLGEGWDLLQVKGDDPRIRDTKWNKERVISILKNRFPSVEVLSMEIGRVYGSEELCLKGLKVLIYEVGDVVNLRCSLKGIERGLEL